MIVVANATPLIGLASIGRVFCSKQSRLGLSEVFAPILSSCAVRGSV